MARKKDKVTLCAPKCVRFTPGQEALLEEARQVYRQIYGTSISFSEMIRVTIANELRRYDRNLFIRFIADDQPLLSLMQRGMNREDREELVRLIYEYATNKKS